MKIVFALAVVAVLEWRADITCLQARSGIMQSHRVIASSLITRTTRVGLEQFPEIPTLSGVIADFMQKIILYDDDKKNLNAEMVHLAGMLETEVLAGQVRVKPSASGYPDFRYLPQGTNEDIRPQPIFINGF